MNNISIVTIGSRGDIQPYIALGIGLCKAGFNVQIVADELYRDSVTKRNLSFAPIYTNPKKFFEEDIYKIGKNIFRFAKCVREQFKQIGRRHFKEVLNALDNVDLILFSPLASAAFHIAELKKIPCIGTYLQPVTPTKEFAPTFIHELPVWFPFKKLTNRLLFRLNNKIYFYLVKDVVNECRKEILNLEPLSWKVYSNADLSDMPIIYGFSKYVIPRPNDWKSNVNVAGYWFLERENDWVPPLKLLEFIEYGSPPVYFGFGSMIDKEITTVTNIIIDALEITGRRGIISCGWNEIERLNLPSNIFLVEDIPHDWLFPKMAAVVHHGGAGTTAAGLKAGIPSIIIPFSFDQPFWANIVYKLGAGPKPITRNKLTSDNLATAIDSVFHNSRYSKKAKELSKKLEIENGVLNAVEFIKNLPL